jgi:histidine triad (HIT) family protein
MIDCLFCKIVASDIPADIVYEDEQILVFKDINPQAAVHLLVIPKIHLTSLDDLRDEHQMLIGHIMVKLPHLARDQGLLVGFRTIINTGPGGGQEVGHIHVHLLGGEGLSSFN